MNRISVVGTSGSGKTTLSNALAQRLGLPCIELDALYWGPNWAQAEPQVFRARVAEALEGDRWICDGNYSIARDIILPRADTLVWLDLPFRVVLGRTIRRTAGRARSREPMWNGNVENWRKGANLVWWAIHTHHGRRRRWEEWLRRPQIAHLQVFRLRSDGEVDRWLQSVGR